MKTNPRNELMKLFYNAFSSFSLNIVSKLLLFFSNIFYARILGTTEYGVYLYLSSWIAILGIPTGLGTREYCVRESAVLIASANHYKIQQMINWATSNVFKAYLITVTASSLIAWSMNFFERINFFFTYCAAIPMVLLTAQIGIRYAVLRGHDRIVLAQAPESIIKPLTQVFLFFFAWVMVDNLFSWHLMLTASISAGITLLFSKQFTKSVLIGDRTIAKASKRQSRKWFRSTLPFLFISGLSLLNNQIGIIMLGSIGGPEQVSIFRVASYGAEFLSFFLMAANISLAPTIAQLWQAAKKDELQKLISRSIRTVVLITLPATAIFLFISDWLLLLFGPDYVQGAFVLKILCIAQLINVAMGSVALILNMCGYEKLTAWGVGFSLLVNIVVNLFLIPRWGFNGAAVSAAISIAVWNLFLLVSVKKTTGLRPSVLGI